MVTMKLILTLLIASLTGGFIAYKATNETLNMQTNLGAAPFTIQSEQLADTPVNGYILSTDGTDNSWIANTGGGGGGAGLFQYTASTNVITPIVASTSNTARLTIDNIRATSTATSSVFHNASTTGVSATNFWGALVGNADTATALAANGANCSAGSSPLGVDASGAVESCFDVWTEAENTAAAYINAASIDTYTELNTIVADVTLTHNGLIDTSAELRGILTDEVGTGAAYFVGGALGTPASVTLTNGTGLPISTGLTGAGTGVLTALGVNVGTAGSFVVNGGALGTPSSGVGTNLTSLNATQLTTGTVPAARVGAAHIDAITEIASALKDGTAACASGLLCLGGHTHAISTEISGLGTNVATFLATPSSANLASAITDETGTGALVFGTSPTLTSFFGTPCTGNEFLQDISDTGAFTCTEAAGGGGSGTLSTTTEKIGGGASSTVSYVTDEFMLGGSASSSAEFLFDYTGSQFFINSSTTVASTTILSADASETVIIGEGDNQGDDFWVVGEGIANVFATAGDWIVNGIGSVAEMVLNLNLTVAGDIRIEDGTGASVLKAEQSLISFTLASTSDAFLNAGSVPIAKHVTKARDITQYRCWVEGGTSVVINMTDGTNDTETITCTSSVASDTNVATNSTFTANEKWYAELGTVTGSVNYVTFEALGYVE